MLKKAKVFLMNIIVIAKDLLFELPFESYNVFDGIIIKYRSYLPDKINFYLIKSMLVKQGYLEDNAKQIAYQFIRHNKSIDDSLFIPVTIAILPAISPKEMLDMFSTTKKVTVIEGDTLEEKIKNFDEAVRRIRGRRL